jgi:hypothetical protein
MFISNSVSLLLLGLMMSTVGDVVGYRTLSQVRQLEQGPQSDPKATLAAEAARLQKGNNAWGRDLML